MNRQTWAQRIAPQTAYRRAAGRRRYNAARQRAAHKRLLPLAKVIARTGDLEAVLRGKRDAANMPRGLISALAATFGVHRSTVCRDIGRLARWRAWELDYSGATDIVTIRLSGLGTLAYRL